MEDYEKKSRLYSAAKKGIAVALSVVMALPVSLTNVASVQAEETQTGALPAETTEESGAAYEETSTVDAGIALHEEACAADSEAETYEGFTYEVTEENTVTITGYEGSDTELAIPAEIEGYPVTSIGDRAFQSCSSLTNVTIPEGVTSIGTEAFYGCSSLASIIIPESVTKIGYRTFSDCGSLQEINVNANDGNYISESGVLYSKDQTELLCYPAGKQGSYEIPESVTIVGSGAFEGCDILTSIEIPKDVTEIGSAAFRGCRNLTSIKISEGVTEIGNYAFSGCSSLTSIKIPEGVTNIMYGMFKDCSSLKSIQLPEGVTGIYYDAFCGCNSLTSIEIPSSVTSIGLGFVRGCFSLDVVNTPERVTMLGDSVFSGCSNLREINVDSDNVNYRSENGVLFDKNQTELICYPVGKQGDYRIPDGVISIDAFAFNKCKSMTAVEIPEGITSIGDGAFSECSGLTCIKLSKSVASIGDFAFGGCCNLTSIAFPEKVTDIGYATLSWCSSLKSIAFMGETVPDIDRFVFCNNLDSFETWVMLEKVYVPDVSYDAYVEAFNNSNLLQENTEILKLSEKPTEPAVSAEPTQTPGPISTDDISYEVKENGVAINGYAGEETVVTLPAKIEGKPVTEISAGAFKGNAQLTEVTIPDGVTEIGAEAFAGCGALTEVTIPDSVTEIAADAFADSPNITIACFEGSAAYAYAVSNGISYRLLSKPAADVAYGDLDGKGGITAADALTVLQIVVKLKVPTDVQSRAADVNGDKNVSAADALLILQKVVKLIDSFPVEKAAL